MVNKIKSFFNNIKNIFIRKSSNIELDEEFDLEKESRRSLLLDDVDK